MTTNLWAIPGIFMFYGASVEAKPHKHNAIQIVWPSDNTTVTVLGSQITTPLVIATNVEHKLVMQAGWVILVEQQSWLGVLLSRYLQDQSYREITNLTDFSYTGNEQLRAATLPNSLPISLLCPLLQRLNINWQQPAELSNINGQRLDQRISHLLLRLNNCFGQECLKPAHWRAHEVAKELAISESRFLHLFRQEMGITWRAYLLWRRLLCAVAAIKQGKNATEAAYQTGFSDSAHLSRTFHKLFGMTLRDAKTSSTLLH